ncbi:MAG: PEGA domain-containing protein [Spirochaetaceae bacterium]|jgi:hypothetical protein|nr:PEGA domain-containing protein [Spirochaetaceae bacterium]
MKPRHAALVCLFCLAYIQGKLHAESIRALIEGNVHIELDNPEGVAVPLSYIGSVAISLGQDIRFFRGLELELTAPQTYLDYHGTLAMVLYAELGDIPGPGVADVDAQQIGFEVLPNKIQSVYQIPLRASHGLRTTPYISVPTEVVSPLSFPLLFRIMPVIKGLPEEIESMVFQLHIKPILSSEGAVKISIRYPEQLPGKPFVLLIDDEVVENPHEERLLREGPHNLVIVSDDYRNESRRFLIERGKTADITVELQDPTPIIIFEAPENARIYVDNDLLPNTMKPYPVEPGRHEVKFQMSDYSIIRTLTVQKGKTYRVSLTVDITISESE